MKKKTIRFGTAALIGITAAVLIRGVSGSGTVERNEIDVSETVSASVHEGTQEVVEETVPEELIDLNNSICPVMGSEVMEGQFVDWGGYRVHFCCAGCDTEFLSDPDKYLSILAEEPEVAELLGIECASCYPDSCVCEQPASSCCGGCQ